VLAVMSQRLPRRLKLETGFTLMEVLVVILIVGILAAIAIASLISQKGKATDATAKALARTAESAAEVYSTDHNGVFKELSVAQLQSIESTLNDKSAAELLKAEPTKVAGGYIVETISGKSTGNTFRIERTPSGSLARTCAVENTGGCPAGGKW
jgi:prepilin-type N-terminal cleavage/methylation domain-containing protein